MVLGNSSERVVRQPPQRDQDPQVENHWSKLYTVYFLNGFYKCGLADYLLVASSKTERRCEIVVMMTMDQETLVGHTLLLDMGGWPIYTGVTLNH